MILLVGVKVQPAQAAVCGRPSPAGADTKKPDAGSARLSLQAVGCTFMSIASYIQYILKHIELRIYGAHFSPVTALFDCITNLIW